MNDPDANPSLRGRDNEQDTSRTATSVEHQCGTVASGFSCCAIPPLPIPTQLDADSISYDLITPVRRNSLVNVPAPPTTATSLVNREEVRTGVPYSALATQSLWVTPPAPPSICTPAASSRNPTSSYPVFRRQSLRENNLSTGQHDRFQSVTPSSSPFLRSTGGPDTVRTNSRHHGNPTAVVAPAPVQPISNTLPHQGMQTPHFFGQPSTSHQYPGHSLKDRAPVSLSVHLGALPPSDSSPPILDTANTNTNPVLDIGNQVYSVPPSSHNACADRDEIGSLPIRSATTSSSSCTPGFHPQSIMNYQERHHPTMSMSPSRSRSRTTIRPNSRRQSRPTTPMVNCSSVTQPVGNRLASSPQTTLYTTHTGNTHHPARSGYDSQLTSEEVQTNLPHHDLSTQSSAGDVSLMSAYTYTSSHGEAGPIITQNNPSGRNTLIMACDTRQASQAIADRRRSPSHSYTANPFSPAPASSDNIRSRMATGNPAPPTTRTIPGSYDGNSSMQGSSHPEHQHTPFNDQSIGLQGRQTHGVEPSMPYVGPAMSSHHFLDPILAALTESHDQFEITLRKSTQRYDENITALRDEIRALGDTHNNLPRKRDKRAKEEDPRMKDPFRPMFLSYLRCHLLRLLKVGNVDELHVVTPLTEGELDAYEKRTTGCISISATNWRYDFSRQRDCLFNLEAERIFAESFLDELRSGSYTHPNPVPVQFWDVIHIQSSFHRQLKYIRDLYEQQICPNHNKSQAKLAQKARARRKDNLYTSRDEFVSTNEKYACHRMLFKYGGKECVSSDGSDYDSDGSLMGYAIIKPIWRSDTFSDLHRQLDADIKSARLPTKPGHRRIAGNKPRIRIPSPRVNVLATAPPFLPRNCYDETWLSGLRNFERQDLQVADFDYNFVDGLYE